ncbi:MAG: carboxypeptidase regulatory-like domain-containing protein [Bacteroidota bacterium]|nr:carboxypeptidase regulatory-like domain-containing protein [Bacteroidota bacterium]
MQRNLLILFITALGFAQCSSSHVRTKRNFEQKQGIEGFVYRISGNRMPAPNAPAVPPAGFTTTVYIYALTNLNNVTRIGQTPFYQSIATALITTTQSDSTGHFNIQLPEGKYSLFIKLKDQFYSNLYDTENNIAPVEVKKGMMSKIILKADADATY